MVTNNNNKMYNHFKIWSYLKGNCIVVLCCEIFTYLLVLGDLHGWLNKCNIQYHHISVMIICGLPQACGYYDPPGKEQKNRAVFIRKAKQC